MLAMLSSAELLIQQLETASYACEGLISEALDQAQPALQSGNPEALAGALTFTLGRLQALVSFIQDRPIPAEILIPIALERKHFNRVEQANTKQKARMKLRRESEAESEAKPE
jgi:hypothetical protein